MSGFCPLALPQRPAFLRRHRALPVPPPGLLRARRRLRRLRPLVLLPPGPDPAQPPLPLLRHLPRRRRPRQVEPPPRLPAAPHLRLPRRRRPPLQRLLQDHPHHPLLPQPPHRARRRPELPLLRLRIQGPRPEGAAPGAVRHRAQVLRPHRHARRRRPPGARRRQRAEARQGRVRDAAGQPAVERHPAHRHLRRARRLLRPRRHARRRRAQPRRPPGPRPLLLQVRPARGQSAHNDGIAVDQEGDGGGAAAERADGDIRVRALLHPGHHQEDLQPQIRLPHQKG
uniref:Uncharacterized protein n=1 Tax=Triticum urartu TaxID=4572 RepID=A0A8R7TRR5_TRIUA